MIKHLKRFFNITFALILLCYHGFSQEVISYNITGKYTTVNGDRLTLESSVLQESKEIFIGLPSNYSDTISYPIVLVLEGEVLFETFAPLTKLMAEVDEIPECIVVGIPFYNEHLDYAPKINSVPESGNADKMLQFYKVELFPLLESLYSCSDKRVIWAHSGLGGIFCTYLLLGPDNQFNAILSSSPNLKWMTQYTENDEVFKEVARKENLFYYLTFGGDEGVEYMSEMYNHVERFKKILEDKAPNNLNWVSELKENNNHFTNAIETYMEGLKLYFDSID